MREDASPAGTSRKGAAVLRTLYLSSRTFPAHTATLFTLAVAEGLLPGVSVLCGKQVVDGLVAGRPFSEVLPWVVAEGAIWLAIYFVNLVTPVVEELLSLGLDHRVTVSLLGRAARMPLLEVEESKTQDAVAWALGTAGGRPSGMVSRAAGLARDLLCATFIGGILWELSPWMVLLVVAVVIPSFILEMRQSAEVSEVSRLRTPDARAQSWISSALTESRLAGEIRVLGIVDALLGKYDETHRRLSDEDARRMLRHLVGSAALYTIHVVTMSATYAWVIYQACEGSATIGEATVALGALGQGAYSVSAALRSVEKLVDDDRRLSDLYRVLDAPEAAQRAASPLSGEDVLLEDVSFTYPGAEAPSLSGITLRVRAGEVVAVVGENGAGKTTLVKILTGLYAPTSGTVSGVGEARVLFQDFARFPLTVEENIRLGGDTMGVQEAAELALAAPFIGALPDGYGTRLGRDFGRELSGGEWQRVALARAISGRGLLILDEPTSAMDAEAAAAVVSRIRELARGLPCIIITHDERVWASADRVLHLRGGRLSR